MTAVDYAEQAVDQLETFDDHVSNRILDKVDEAAEWPDHRLDPLTEYPYYKLRIGDNRAIVTWDREADHLIVEAVGHRRNVYDRHLPP
jgi:mRNA interferase RelE/StbE